MSRQPNLLKDLIGPGGSVDLATAGLVAVSVVAGPGDRELDRLTAGQGFATPAFYLEGATRYIARASSGRKPLASVGEGITVLTEGVLELPVSGEWLTGYEAERVPVSALPAWGYDPAFIPPRRRAKPGTPRDEGRLEDAHSSTAAPDATAPAAGGPASQQPRAAESDAACEQANDPHRLARLFLERYRHPNGLKLRYWNDDFVRWERGSYRQVSEKELRAELTTFVRKVFEEDARTERATPVAKGNRSAVRHVTRPLVANVLQALEGMCLLAGETQAPAWVDATGPAVERLIVAPNGTLDPDTRALRSPTPRMFTFNCLSFDIDLNAPPPVEWLAFLKSLWADDPDSVLLLQEWFGYSLTSDTSRQKALLVIGPPRSGKSTIASILRSLVGEGNAAGPTLAGLAENFGLSALLGKQLAIVADARLSGRADATAVTERLLSITGEDAVTLDRKFKKPITAKLNTRFVIISNELPRFIDASGALASRFVVLRMTQSWLNKEDHGLRERLLRELPGILNWALAGLARLRATGRFTQPESGSELIREMSDLSSPVGAFVRARCRLGRGLRVHVEELFAAWKGWCEEQGRKEPGTVAVFGRDLAAAAPGVRTKQVREGGNRFRIYEGIELGDPEVEESCHAMSRVSCHCGSIVGESVGEVDVGGRRDKSRVTSRDTPGLTFEEGVIE